MGKKMLFCDNPVMEPGTQLGYPLSVGTTCAQVLPPVRHQFQNIHFNPVQSNQISGNEKMFDKLVQWNPSFNPWSKWNKQIKTDFLEKVEDGKTPRAGTKKISF